MEHEGDAPCNDCAEKARKAAAEANATRLEFIGGLSAVASRDHTNIRLAAGAGMGFHGDYIAVETFTDNAADEDDAADKLGKAVASAASMIAES